MDMRFGVDVGMAPFLFERAARINPDVPQARLSANRPGPSMPPPAGARAQAFAYFE
jgi:hypothetical protein